MTKEEIVDELKDILAGIRLADLHEAPSDSFRFGTAWVGFDILNLLEKISVDKD